MENLLLTILSIVFSIVSVVAIILVVILMTKPPKKDDTPPSFQYCNLDILNIGNYSIGVGMDEEQLIIQSSLATYPKIVFNLMNRNRPLMFAFNQKNKFLYSYLNTFQVLPLSSTKLYDNNDNSICKFPDTLTMDNFKINEFTCKQESVGSITFANDIKLETINDVLVMYGKSGQFEFNNTNNVFKVTNLQKTEDGKNTDSSGSYLYFDGSYFCSNPENNANNCKGTQELSDKTDKKLMTNQQNSSKMNGISFSNGYILYAVKDSLIIKGKAGTVNFNLNGGDNLFTLNDTLTGNYFYYNYQNSFGVKTNFNPTPPKCYSNVGQIQFTDGSVYTGKNMTGVENITGLQSLQFENKMKLKGDDNSIKVNIEDVPEEKKRDKSPPDLASFNIAGSDAFTASGQNGAYFYVNPNVYGGKGLKLKF